MSKEAEEKVIVKGKEEKVITKEKEEVLMDLECFLDLLLVQKSFRKYYYKNYGGQEVLKTHTQWSKITGLKDLS